MSPDPSYREKIIAEADRVRAAWESDDEPGVRAMLRDAHIDVIEWLRVTWRDSRLLAVVYEEHMRRLTQEPE